MADDESEENLLRSVTLQNARSILAARRRGERELLESREALRASEARYRSVVEGSLHGIIVQQDERIVYANPAMSRLFGFASASEMIGLSPFEDLIADEDVSLFRARTAAVQAGQFVEPHPGWQARRRDGATMWISSTAHLSEWQGRPAVTSFYFDITQTKRAEQALRESEERYRSALSAGRMGAWETDLVARTRKWTEEGLALFGLSLPGGMGRVGGEEDEYASSIHPEDRHFVKGFYRQADTVDSFLAEYRIVRPDGAVLWLSGRGQVVSRKPDGGAHRLISIMADVTDQKKRELQKQFLLRETIHRAKNLLTVIQSIARQTSRTAGSWDEFDSRFGLRLEGLGATMEVLVRQEWRGARLGDLIRQHLIPFVDAESPRMVIAGPDLQLSAEAAQAIGLAIHELATNAVKYGALSGSAGKVTASWTLEEGDGEPNLRFFWLEEDGPDFEPPDRKGFGHVVLEQMIARSLQGESKIDFAPGGLKYSLSVPVRNLGKTG